MKQNNNERVIFYAFMSLAAISKLVVTLLDPDGKLSEELFEEFPESFRRLVNNQK